MMDGPIECEIKLRLASRDDLLRMLQHLPCPRRWGLQLNLYLDTPTRDLAARELALRLRITPDHARLTLKSGRGVTGCTFRCTEIEEAVDREAAIGWVHGRAPLPTSPHFAADGLDLHDPRLRPVNWSLTHRALCDIDDITIEVDETLFSDGQRDWEIEVEHPDPDAALAVVQRVAQAAGVLLHAQTRTKQARALACSPRLEPWIPVGDPALGIPGDIPLS